jgi:hypothetical protein
MSKDLNMKVKPLENTLRVLISLTEKRYGTIQDFELLKRLIEKEFDVEVDIEMLVQVYITDLEIEDRELMYSRYGHSINKSYHKEK